MKQLTEVWRSCTSDNVEANESCLVLNPDADADRRLEGIVIRKCCSRVTVTD